MYMKRIMTKADVTIYCDCKVSPWFKVGILVMKLGAYICTKWGGISIKTEVKK